MDLKWSAADAEFRDEVRSFLDEKLTPPSCAARVA